LLRPEKALTEEIEALKKTAGGPVNIRDEHRWARRSCGLFIAG